MKRYFLLVLVGLIFQFVSCKKKPELPIVRTIGANNVGLNYFTAYGDITGLDITAKGFCWDTTSNVSVDKMHTDEGKGSDSFNSTFNNLIANKKYYLKAYAINETGIAYGDLITVQTLISPNIITQNILVQSYDYATTSVAITSNNYSLISVGVCYSTQKNPDVTKNIVSSTQTSTTFTMNNLNEKTVYYYKAFAVYSFGTFYGTEKSFTTTAAPLPLVIFTNTGTVTDNQANIYKTVKIGSQTWMAENLKVQNYRDGTPIPYINSGLNNWSLVSSGAIGYFNNNYSNYVTCGVLYNYYTIEDARGIAPVGWHIPTANEWQTLINTLNSTNTSYSLSAVSQLYAVGAWNGLTCNSNNYSNMNIIPAGQRTSQSVDADLGTLTGFWTSNSNGAYASIVFFDNTCFTMSTNKLKNFGYSIRCVKD